MSRLMGRRSTVKVAPEPGGEAVIFTCDWETPPRDSRPLARWWWPGGSVEQTKCEAQLRLLSEVGFGSVEVQPFLLGLNGDDLAADPKLRTVGEKSFIEDITFCATKCVEFGMAYDITLGSGWPGGLPTEKANGETQLLMETVANVCGPKKLEASLPPPPGASYRSMVQNVLDALGEPDTEAKVVAVLAGQLGADSEDGEKDGCPTLKNTVDITSCVVEGGKHGYGSINWEAPEGKWRVIVLYRNSTSHFVMGGAFPGKKDEALVVDHMTAQGANALLDCFGKRVTDACGDKIRGVFVDSFEMIAELPFTATFLQAFEEQMGYDLTPDLPLMFRTGGESKYSDMVDFFGLYGDPIYTSAEPQRWRRQRLKHATRDLETL